jgi:lysyl-tRNA synthetase class I
MKLVIVTVVDQYRKDVVKLFKKAEIESFSESDIEGFKTRSAGNLASNWFAGERIGADSQVFFSFAQEERVDVLLELIKEFNQNLESNNPMRAVVVPIEKYI